MVYAAHARKDHLTILSLELSFKKYILLTFNLSGLLSLKRSHYVDINCDIDNRGRQIFGDI